MTPTPRARRTSRFATTAGCRNISTFMAGATSTGTAVARYSVESASSAMPCANFPRMLAVAGATSSRSGPDAVVVGGMALGAHRMAREGLERHRGDELRRMPRHNDVHVHVALLQLAQHLARLVGVDAAGDAENDPGRRTTPLPGPRG